MFSTADRLIPFQRHNNGKQLQSDVGGSFRAASTFEPSMIIIRILVLQTIYYSVILILVCLFDWTVSWKAESLSALMAPGSGVSLESSFFDLLAIMAIHFAAALFTYVSCPVIISIVEFWYANC